MKKRLLHLQALGISLITVLSILLITASTSASGNLIGYWNFDEASGSTYADSSGNSNDGTIVSGGVTHSTEVPPITCFDDPYSVGFDGSGGYVAIPDNATMDPANQITISFWMNANTVTNGYQHIVFKQGPVVTSYGVWLSGNHVYMEDNDNSVHSLTSSATITPGTWYYITVTYDGQTQKLYINGALDNSQPLSNITLTYENSPVKIGSGDYNNPFSGYVDDLRIYGTALSQSEVSDLAGGGCGPGVAPAPTQDDTVPPASQSTPSNTPADPSESLAPATGYGKPASNGMALVLICVAVAAVSLGSGIYLLCRQKKLSGRYLRKL